jgi:NADH-quinone oxidoreductase subunit J
MIGPERVANPGLSWIGPSVLAAVLLAEVVYIIARSPAAAPAGGPAASRISQLAQVGPARVGIALIGPYVVGVEVSAFLLLAGLVGAYHLGRRRGAADATSAAGAAAAGRGRARVEEGEA